MAANSASSRLQDLRSSLAAREYWKRTWSTSKGVELTGTEGVEGVLDVGRKLTQLLVVVGGEGLAGYLTF